MEMIAGNTKVGTKTTRGEKPEEIGVEDALHFGEEIRNLLVAAPPETGNSFTALLELPASQAMELLHDSPPQTETDGTPPAEIWRKPCFRSDAAPLERASRFAAFAAAENSPETSSIPPNSSRRLKQERVGSDSNPSLPDLVAESNYQKSTKRKEREKKGKWSTKRSKSAGNETSSGDGEKLPYVHVRARRGQATDSHSLAERARREKINARMKLLQELVPGCNKISGTAVVLDEIINHVQSLQRQVEFLSMRLAAVNPRIDFTLDTILAAESGSSMDSNFPDMVMPLMWPEGQLNGNRQRYQQLCHFDGLHQPVWGGEDNPIFTTAEKLLLSYDYSTNSASPPSNQLKMEL